MKDVLDSLINAFSMYSAIPMPKSRWDRKGMRYLLCFFPLVGVVIGVLLLGWHWIALRMELSPALFGVVAALLPVAVSGGVHMDGLMDTADALASHAPPARRQEILKDPHAGAFAVLACCGYLLLQVGLWCQLWDRPLLAALPAVACVLSRICNALSIATFPCAKTSGLVHLFADSAAKHGVVGCCAVFGLACLALCLWISPLWGAVGGVLTAVAFLAHRRMCVRGFGGNSGDLAGFLLQALELLWLGVAALGSAM